VIDFRLSLVDRFGEEVVRVLIHARKSYPGRAIYPNVSILPGTSGHPVGTSGTNNSRTKTGSSCWLGTKFSLPEMLEPTGKSRLFREWPKILSLARLPVPPSPRCDFATLSSGVEN
jgi:hypothetical protein